jgi:hypothetical protein
MKRDLVSRVMREMGKKGGKAGGSKGGRSRMKSLTPEERIKLATQAAAARWKGHQRAKPKKVNAGGEERLSKLGKQRNR